MKKKECVLIFSHSNYRIRSAGTEKYISEIEMLLKKGGKSLVQVFPMVDLNRKIKKVFPWFKGEYMGVNCEGIFCGACEKQKLLAFLHNISVKHNLSYIGIQIHHLSGWDLEGVDEAVQELCLPVILLIHDYYMICPYIEIPDGGLDRECSKMIGAPDENRCGGCKYQQDGMQSYQNMRRFLEHVSEYIVRILTPSESALKIWVSAFAEAQKKAMVRPHLKYEFKHYGRSVNDKIRIGYMGSLMKSKGYEKWKQIIRELPSEKYEFYCFSARASGEKGVHDIYVNFQDRDCQGMAEQLKQHNIDIAFLWSIWAETYSYTYYEAYEAGCYVITNEYSGNIAAQVAGNGNGKVFREFSECLEWLQNVSEVKANLQRYGDTNSVPVNVEPNNSMEEFRLPETKKTDLEQGKPHPFIKNFIVSWFYARLRKYPV